MNKSLQTVQMKASTDYKVFDSKDDITVAYLRKGVAGIYFVDTTPTRYLTQQDIIYLGTMLKQLNNN